MEEAPKHCSNPVKGLECIISQGTIDCPGRGEEPEVAVSLLGGSVRDSPEVCTIGARTAVAFSEICRNGGGRTNQLVCDWLKWGGYLRRDLDCDTGSFDGVLINGET